MPGSLLRGSHDSLFLIFDHCYRLSTDPYHQSEEKSSTQSSRAQVSPREGKRCSLLDRTSVPNHILSLIHARLVLAI